MKRKKVEITFAWDPLRWRKRRPQQLGAYNKHSRTYTPQQMKKGRTGYYSSYFEPQSGYLVSAA